MGLSCDICSHVRRGVGDAFGQASQQPRLTTAAPHRSASVPPPPTDSQRPHRGSRHKGLRGRVVRVESSHTPECVSLCLGLPVPPAQLGSLGCRMLTVSYTIAGCCVIYDIDRLPAHPGLACLPAGTADLRKSWVVVRALRYCVEYCERLVLQVYSGSTRRQA